MHDAGGGERKKDSRVSQGITGVVVEPVEIVAYDPGWPDAFRLTGMQLRNALGDYPDRIDHIGSTAIPGIAAKPIIDIQISVPCLEPMSSYLPSMQALGFVWRKDNPALTKRYFREAPGNKRTHIHVRQTGSWHEQYALLFRDYVRSSAEDRARYETVKRQLAEKFRLNRLAYTDGKAEIFWDIIRCADEWAGTTGWQPGPSDA